MKKSRNNENKITVILLMVYLVVLTWIILFKMQLSFQDLPQFRKINLIPYSSSVIKNGKIDTGEIIYNVLAFIPFGTYISMVKPNWSLWKKFAPIVGSSLSFETLQYIFAIGGSDITDLIGNSLGGILGVGVYFVFLKLFRRKANKILNVLAFIGTICIGALIMYYLLGFIRYNV